jgi:DNA-binding MarR family transcriptional regulator
MGRLQDDLKQQRPFASVEEETYLNLVRTTDFLNRQVAAVLKPHHLSEAQYNVLRILRGAGQAGHTCSEIASRLVTRDPDVTRLLDKLEARALLARSREHADRRVVTTRITAPGLALLKSLDRPLREAVKGMLAHLPATHLSTLTGLLERARQASLPGETRAAVARPTGARAGRAGGRATG